VNDSDAGSARESGRFIVMEGGEGVGKTTQWEQVTERLTAAGHRVVALREPGGTPAGDMLRRVLLDPSSTLAPNTEALLFAASRAQLVHSVIRPALAEDATVLVDRFLLSTYAYQGAGRGIAIDTLRAINAAATEGVAPDLTLLLTMPLDDALGRARARGDADRMEREDRAFHERVHQAFLRATDVAWQTAHPEIGRVVTIDASGHAHEVTAKCLDALALRWPSRFGALSVRRTPTRGGSAAASADAAHPAPTNSKVEVARG
jgi:dTMP kinase